ncbi:MAG TPA: hypothetical protein VF503_30605 [Sphingobium sp.]|uniref:hypothetical protein n=1 Tax=Sphingobium sp. TaxID=1912891 RepID=UPI002ED36D99
MNLSLTNLVTDQLYYTLADTLYATHGYAIPAYWTSTSVDHQQLTQNPAGGLGVPANYLLPYVQFAASDRIPNGPANFTTYQKVSNGQTVTAEVYNSGTANTEFALTYASFAQFHYRRVLCNHRHVQLRRQFQQPEL